MDAREYLERIVSHEEKTLFLLANPDMPKVKERCFKPLLGILCCASLFEDQILRADANGVAHSREGVSYRIGLLRESGRSEYEIYDAITSLRDSFLSEKGIDLSHGYLGISLRKLHWTLYDSVLRGLDRLLAK